MAKETTHCRARPLASLICVLPALLLCSACDDAPSDAVPIPEKTGVTAAASAKAKAPTRKKKAVVGAQPRVSLKGASPATPKPVNTNKPPTVEQWNAQTKEVTVRGSSALGCETKMVDSWLRISCRGKNHSGGTPTSVVISKGGKDGRTFRFSTAGVTSLVLPFVEGVDVKADFRWTDKSAELHVFWPRGAPEPPPKGIFTVQ